MADKKNIFEFRPDESPLLNWLEDNSQTGEPPKIDAAYAVRSAIKLPIAPIVQNNKATFKFIVFMIGYPDMVVIRFNNLKVNALRSFRGKNTYEAYIDVNLDYQLNDLTFEVLAFDRISKQVADTKIINITVDKKGRFAAENEPFFQSIDYHIYSTGVIEKHIPKNYPNGIKNGKIKYYFHTKDNIQIKVTELDFIFTRRRKNGEEISLIPSGFINTYDYPSGGNARKAYVYNNGDICVEGTKYGKRKYQIDSGFVQLVRMPDKGLNIDNPKIKFEFSGTQRRYCNPEAFAGFIGALAEMGFDEVICTGMCFADATSYPSLAHPNGDCADTAYFSKEEKEKIKVKAFKKFHFKSIISGTKDWYANLDTDTHNGKHNDHLHSGEFDLSIVIDKVI